MLFIKLLSVLCVLNVTIGAYRAESSSPIKHEPVRAEAGCVGKVERVMIVNNPAEHKAFYPSGYIGNVGIIQDVVCLTVMPPTRPDYERSKSTSFLVARLYVWDRVRSKDNHHLYACQEGGTFPYIFSRPGESDRGRGNASWWPSFGVAWSDHNPRSVLVSRYVEGSTDGAPLSPRETGVNPGSDQDRELCNDGKGFITGHWVLGILLCLIGIGCGFQAFRELEKAGDCTASAVTRYAVCQLLFALFFGVGLFAILSSTFQDCVK